MERDWSAVSASSASMRTCNPIREIVDQLTASPNPEKKMLSLSIGDPTLFGNFACPPFLPKLMQENCQSLKYNGYPHSIGYTETREAIAKAYSHRCAPLTADDIIVASGCSGAIEIIMRTLCNEGDNVLIPRPGFSLYQTLCESMGIECRFYNLCHDKDWEADLVEMPNLINSRTRCIIVNNPSNPCGSVYSATHLQEILAVASKYHVPILADEIYADMVFSGETFIPMASFPSDVPILTVGGTAKRFMLPGYRVGWIMIHDRNDVFRKSRVREGLRRITTLILGANSIVQSCVKSLLFDTPESYHTAINRQLEDNAKFAVDIFSRCHGLSVIKPRGAMYMMVRIDLTCFDNISSDVEFCRLLIAEESVMVLPGACFNMPSFFRIVVCPPQAIIQEACERIENFCVRHFKN